MASEVRSTQGAGKPEFGGGQSAFRVGNHGESLMNAHWAVEAFKDDKVRFPGRDFSYVRPMPDHEGVVSVPLAKFTADFDWFAQKARDGTIHTVIFTDKDWNGFEANNLLFRFEQIIDITPVLTRRQIEESGRVIKLIVSNKVEREKKGITWDQLYKPLVEGQERRINVTGNHSHHHYGYFGAYSKEKGPLVSVPGQGFPILSFFDLPKKPKRTPLAPKYSGPKIRITDITHGKLSELMGAFAAADVKMVPLVNTTDNAEFTVGKFFSPTSMPFVSTMTPTTLLKAWRGDELHNVMKKGAIRVRENGKTVAYLAHVLSK